MRKYAFGRTDVIRSVTSALEKLSSQPNPNTLKEAIIAHNNYGKNASNGLGIDRLLLGR